MRRGDITAICVCASLTLLGAAIGLLVAANHPDLPANQVVGGTGLMFFAAGVLAATALRAFFRPLVRIQAQVTDINPHSAKDTVTITYEADGLAYAMRLPRAAFVSLPHKDARFDVILISRGDPFADVEAVREFGPPDKPPAFGEV